MNNRNRLFPVYVLTALVLTFSPLSHAAATLTINVLDGPNEGFNSNAAPDPVSAAAGNAGATLGEQRLNTLQDTLNWWGRRLNGSVTIVVDAQMNAQFCTAGSAVLASAGPTIVVRDFPGAPRAGTWYHSALANTLAGTDLFGGSSDIGTTANSSIDNNNNCLANTNWFYALGQAPAGTISFFKVMLHEIAHGLGVSSFVSTADGSLLGEFPGIYETFLEDHNTPPNSWLSLSNAQRLASMIDTGNLHWTGPNVLAQTGVLFSGVSSGHVRNFDPNPFQGGSSVSHWDTSLSSNITNSVSNRYQELMEPFATGNELVLLTDEMLEDEGWNNFEGDCGNPSTTSQDDIVLNSVMVTTDQDGCISIITTGNTFIPGGTTVTFTAGRTIAFGPGFRVEGGGGTFTVVIDPYKSLRN